MQFVHGSCGRDEALASFRESGARLVMGPMQVGLFENPYVDVAATVEIVGGDEITEWGYDAQRQSIVMLKNDGNVTKAAEEGAEKPTVYIPMQYTVGYTSSSKASQGVYTPGSWELPVDPQNASAYFNVVTDRVSGTLTGPVEEKENRSYFGQSAKITNKTDMDGILYAAENRPEDASVIVAVNATNPMIFSEFESQMDAILMGFSVNNELFFDIVTGKVEPTGLLPLQIPANMETVEAQYEDVPRDMECYVEANGNTYDFALGLNWSSKIEDDRTAKYAVESLTEPETQPVTAEE